MASFVAPVSVSSFFNGKLSVSKKATSSTTCNVVRMSAAEKKENKAAKFVAAAAAIVVSSAAFSGSALADGAALFSNNCAACHPGGINVLQADKPLSKEAIDANIGFSVDSIVGQIIKGRNAMPAFGGRLSDDEIKEVAEYVYGQAEAGWK
mmetsp:Transcript_26294/g.43057  ORF Transcript_26294/g.43057 Transcript_26294/m.43057 type:complete len:151 (+) Transcript_26294:108-560(+)